jgi:NDP-sugar pyrophosphorylase family protein
MRSVLEVEVVYGGTEGDAAAILRARDLLDGMFLLAGGDTIIPARATCELIDLFFSGPRPLAACLASSYFQAAPEHYRVQINPRGDLIRFLPASHPDAKAQPINTGMHVMSAEIFDYIIGLPAYSPPEAALEVGLQRGNRIRVHVSDLHWFALHRAEDFKHWWSVSSTFNSEIGVEHDST